jgi:DNA replication licensing factor MCM7
VHLGKLITVRGIVTRVSEVKPLLLVNAYTCDVCGSETFQEISRKEFTPIAACACRFSPFQVFASNFCRASHFAHRLPQADQVLDRPCEWQSRPHDESGDMVLGGIFLPIPYTSFQAVRAGLLTDTYLTAAAMCDRRDGSRYVFYSSKNNS